MGIMSILLSVWRCSFVRTRVEWKPVHWLALQGLFMVRIFNTDTYFGTDCIALFCRSFSLALLFLKLNLIWAWRWSEFREHFENWCVSGSCLMWFSPKGLSQQTIILHLGGLKTCFSFEWKTQGLCPTLD